MRPVTAGRDAGHARVVTGSRLRFGFESRTEGFSGMALNALEVGQVAQVDRVLKRAAAFVASRAVEPR